MSKAINTPKAEVTSVTFKIPAELKGVSYTKWPEEARKQYQAYRKYLNDKADAEKEEMWNKLLPLLSGEALDIAMAIKEGTKKRTSALTAIFGTEDVAVGDKVPFNMDLISKVQTVNSKGKIQLEIADNNIIVKAINE